jgi:hypothetical protein
MDQSNFAEDDIVKLKIVPLCPTRARLEFCQEENAVVDDSSNKMNIVTL